MNANLLLWAAEASHEESSPATPSAVVFNLFGLDVNSEIVTEWIVIGVLITVAFLATRKLLIRPGKVQAATEVVVDFIIDGVIAPSIGGRERAIRYLPFLGTMFLFIMFSNYVGLLPGSILEIPGFKAPTSALSVPVALAVMAFFATHVSGLKAKGLHYFGHFLEPFPWLLPMNIIETMIQPLSLSLRLFGNVFGGEMIMWVLLTLVPWFVPVPIMGFEVFVGFLQAFIFTVLTAVYIGSATAESH